MDLPSLPCAFADFPAYLETAQTPEAVREKVDPFKAYEHRLRQIYAQEPSHQAVPENHLVPIYQDAFSKLTVKARDIAQESEDLKSKYLLPISDEQRRAHLSPATTPSLREFKKNLDIFSESSLVDLHWDNVVAAGSSVVTALLPVEAPHNASKVSFEARRSTQLMKFVACVEIILS